MYVLGSDHALCQQSWRIHHPFGLTNPPLQVPAINASQSLVFSFKLIADIMLNKVKTWNDAAIAELNPGVALPRLDIIIAYDNRSSANNIWIKELLQIDEFASLPVRYRVCVCMRVRVLARACACVWVHSLLLPLLIHSSCGELVR
jgi:hypothetical protein